MNSLDLKPADAPAALHLDKRGLDESQWRVLRDSVWPGASDKAIALAIDYCSARRLDPFKKPVHIVKVWNSAAKALVETVWPGIAEIRTTAFRTGEYGGCDATEYGTDVVKQFGGGNAAIKITFPAWCRITVYRKVAKGSAERFPVPGPRVYWLETYATKSKDSDMPNSMWLKRPRGQLEKCAEAAALRRAFPEELGSEYTAEEMEGQHIGPERAKDVTPTDDAPRPPTPVKNEDHHASAQSQAS